MARKRKVPLPDGGQLDAEVFGFRSSGEHWNEYLVDDGSVLRLKVVVTEVLRVEDQYDANGNPVYLIQSTNILAVDAPEELKRQGGEET
jgi:hypothetical protein